MRHPYGLLPRLVSAAFFAATPVVARAAELPVACGPGTCGPSGPTAWVTSGAASAALTGNALTIQQTTENAVLNWQSFNVSADGAVTFNQPGSGSVALNQIFQADPSKIFGTLTANGRVFLLNQNGIVFGEGAVVNVGGLLAATLEITPQALANGIAGAINDVTAPNSPAFRSYANGSSSGGIVVDSGASIATAEGGQVLMFAPQIEQRGAIRTPGGQTLLAAGTTVYLAASGDENLRGLLVEVDAADALESSVTNGTDGGAALAEGVGQIVAERGNVTLAGLAVNQLGRVSATTSVRQNGSIRLQARTGNLLSSSGAVQQTGAVGGSLTLGAGTRIEVTLVDDATDKTVDANPQPRSLIELVGASVAVLDDSRVAAGGGDIVVKAQQSQSSTKFGPVPDSATPAEADGSRIYVAPGAVLDVSGADIDLPMERNVLRVELRGNQLRDSPEQRNGPLRGQTVFVDIRRSGTREDGTAWQGTPLADVLGDISTFARSVIERNLLGGSVLLQSQGDVILAPGAAIDVSGGVATYADGVINTTKLLAANGSVVDIGDADPIQPYQRTVSEFVRRHQRWGVTETFRGFANLSPGSFERGYTEGYDAGAITLVTPRAILDGELIGAVETGFHQREPTAALAPGTHRPYTQLPRGASLVLGRTRDGAPEFTSDPLLFAASGSVLPALLNDSGLPFNPRADMLPGTFGALLLRTDLFGADRIADATLISGASITLAAGQSLALPAGGALSLTAPRIEIHGSIDVPSGTLTATAERSPTASTVDDRSLLLIGPTAELTARGLWVNDDERASPDRFHPGSLHVAGGTVGLSSTAGDLVLAPGSRIDVSAGAFRSAAGAVVGGHGGTIALEARPIQNAATFLPVSLELGAELSAYALFDGGTLSVRAGEICVAPGTCAGSTDNVLNLAPQTFAQGGFGSFNLRTNRDGISIEGSTPLLLRQQNLELAADAVFRPSGSSILGFSRGVTLDALVRRPTDLSLRVSIPTSDSASYSEASFLEAPMLRIGEGARIEGDSDATIDLRANTRIAVDGTIAAPSGVVAMLLDETLAVTEFIGAQTIRLGEHAAIDLRGTARIAPNGLGARRGEVLDGGDLSLIANRGYLVLGAGSRIDVSGASGVLDMRATVNDVGLTPVQIGSSAGTIELRAAEGILLSGQLVAAPGVGSSIAGLRPRGGTLRVALDPSGRSDPNFLASLPSLFPTGPRTITLTQERQQLVIGPDTPVPAGLNGQARIAADAVVAGGFDSLALEAWQLPDFDQSLQFIAAPGAIAVDGDVSLSLPAALTLESARFDAAGGHATLAAPYMSLGNTDPTWVTPLTPTPGTGSLTVHAGFLELTGRHVIDGAASTTLASDGDLRLRGLELPTIVGTGIVGSLVTAGDLTLSASQVYATTLSDFELAVRGNPAGVLTIAGNGAAPKNVLSAAATLRLAAPSIVQAGVLRAPLGNIEMTADQLSLRPGSTTSTSTDGLLIPFGTTQGGFAWVYDLANLDFVYGAAQRTPPAQRVALQGRALDIAAGATIDLAGGGDLLAYEFIPGVGGSRDVLSPSVRPDEFAIVPSLDVDVAPFDPREYVGSSLRAGDSVFLEAGSGVPAGEYVLLPARYSLLPGAFLIREVGGYQDIVPGESFARVDGGTIVAGYRALAGTGIASGGSRRSGFVIRPAELARREAEYTTTVANTFFAEQAAAGASASPRLPRDAGVLALSATESLLLNGGLRAQAATDGRGAAVDVSSTRLRVASSGTSATTPGEVVIDAAGLSRLGAESVLLGGRRSTTAAGTAIDVTSEQLTIAADTVLVIPELLLAARDTLVVDRGAELKGITVLADTGAVVAGTGTGVEEQRYLLAGDAAFLRVTGGAQADIERTGEAGLLGTLDVRETAKLDAGAGAILLDATRDTILVGDLVLAGGSLNLGASQITLGADGVVAAGLVLTTDDLAKLAIDELVLTSRSTVDLSGDVTLGLNRLIVDAAGLRGVGGGVASLDVAQTIRLTNTAGSSLVPAAGGGSLALHAGTFELGRGAFALDGFARSELTSAGPLTFADGALLTSTGDLAWSGTYLTGLTGARGGIDVDGSLSLARIGTSVADPAGLGLGARLDMTAAQIRHDGAIILPGGTASLRADGARNAAIAGSGSVLLGAGATVDLRGQVRSFDGVGVSAPSGRVELAAADGDVAIAGGATVDVRGAVNGDAGNVSILASRGDVQLDGALLGNSAGGRGGSLEIDALSFGGVAAALGQASAGGFTESFWLRLRGAGDLVVNGALRAHDVNVVAEQGSVRVSGNIDATGLAAGRVRLAASDSVIVDGSIAAGASGAGQHGGTVELLAASGGVLVNPTASVGVAGGDGGDGGTVLLRLPRGSVGTLLDADATNDQFVLGGAFSGVRALTVEGYQAYDEADGILSDIDVVEGAANPWFTDAEIFMANGAAVRTALGRDGDPALRIVPGIEIRSAGDLTLAASWNLFPWRFAGAPGVLTLRAGGDLLFDGSLSDGFAALTGVEGFQLSTMDPGESWSYRLIGGASTASADPLAVHGLLDTPPLGAGSGDVRLGDGTTNAPRMVRTGTGTIEIAAANDFVLGNQQSVVYTAGVSGPGIRFGTAANTLGSRAYPIDGGDIAISAGRHVRGARTDQFVNAWLWRVGLPATGGPQSAVGWTVNFQRFQQNVGALGGGDVRVAAGGDITDFSASLPSIGRQIGGTTLATSVVEVVGGGALDVAAGGSILGGSYYVGRGSAEVRAGDEVGTYLRPTGTTSLAPLFGLGDSTLAVTARNDLMVEAIVNPSLVPPGLSQLPLGGNRRPSYFTTYTDAAAARLVSVAGDLFLEDNSIAVAGELTSMAFGVNDSPDLLSLRTAPPTLRAAALSGDVVLEGTLALFPAPKGNVELFAQNDVRLSGDTGYVLLALSDAPVAVLPSIKAPQQDTTRLTLLTHGSVTQNLRASLNSPVPVHADANQPDGVPDVTPARVVAGMGNVDLSTSDADASSLLYFAKPVRVLAGADMIDLPLQAQHVRETDISVLQAGRDIRYTAARDPFGRLNQNLSSVVVDGPGLLQIATGRDVDLQTSQGVVTRGNLDNRFLPDGGASVSVLAGLGDTGAPAYDAFDDKYLASGSDYAADLIAYVERMSGVSGLSFSEARARYDAFDDSRRRPFAEQVLVAELRTAGRKAAASVNRDDFAPAFAALETLFPGSNPATDNGETNSFLGDVRLFFSRLYTLAGGDISVFAPGGEINVGLATPPAAFGVAKAASQLGLVVQQSGSVTAVSYNDFQVNESRVFSADGGNILVWSTNGDIDAGRGAKTAISAPPPTVTIDENGQTKVLFPAALTGSGIQTLATTPGRKPGNVDLFAPRGVVNAGDAGIVAGNLTIAATAVLGADNISVSGVSVGVPVDTGGFAAALTGVSAVGSSATNAAEDTVGAQREAQQSSTPLADQALGFLDVFVTGFGEEACDPQKENCQQER